MSKDKIKVEYIETDKLIPYANNARKHGEADVDAIMASIREFGFTNPILTWKGIVAAGHGRLIAAKRLGLDKVPTIALDYLTDEQRRAYILADNKTAELSGWDFDVLDAELKEITDIDMTEFGFDLQDDEMQGGELSEDDYEPDVPEEPRAKVGDIYQLGEHRLICGDCTDRAVIEKLMDGVKADLLLTDPPYGISVVGGGVQSAQAIGRVGGGGPLHFKTRKSRRRRTAPLQAE